MIDAVLSDIPVEYRDRYAALLEQPTVDPARLRRDVKVYLETVKQVGVMVKLLDMGVAERLAAVALRLLDHAERSAGDREVTRVVQAGVRYFILEDEDEEITGVLGFDDDTQVINAVCRAVGLGELVLPLQRHA